jgi:membrane protease YdiL (CAAX protease family)
MTTTTRAEASTSWRVPHPVATVVLALVVTVVASFLFSRATGLLGQVVDAPVGAFTLAAGVLLTAASPTRFGWAWHDTGRHWRAVLAALGAVIAVVAAYRVLGHVTPYEPSVAEFLLVPPGEEVLFRGFVVTVLLVLFRRSMTPSDTALWAVIVAAVGFGVGHLGNFGYVPTVFVVFQVAVAVALGIVAGWLRVRTASLIAPVLVHAAVNVVAVA